MLEDGILEGRKVFGNIIKYIRMGASSNFGNMFSMLGSSYLFNFLPMLPIQILVNNLLYDGSQLGIPSDNIDDEYLKTPRKWDIANIRRFMIYIGPISSIFDYATFFLMGYIFKCVTAWVSTGVQTPVDLVARFASIDPKDLDATYSAALFHTGWFVESLFTQTLIVHIIRTRKIPFIQSIASPFLMFTTFLALFIGGVLPYTPFAHDLGLVPLPAIYWAWIAGFMLLYATLTHFVKVWFHNKYGID